MSGDQEPDQDALVLDKNEVAIILRDDADDVLTRLAFGTEPGEGEDVPQAVQLAVALLTRLQEDEDFHQEVLDWFDTYTAELDEN